MLTSLERLGHLHGDFGQKLGTKSWFKIDSKILLKISWLLHLPQDNQLQWQ